MTKPVLIKVRYKFKDESNHITISITKEQYQNLLKLPIIDRCEIVGTSTKQMTAKEKDAFNQRLKQIFKNDTSHTQFLLK